MDITDFVDTVHRPPALPLETWRDIFEQVHHAADLANAARWCKFLQFEAEAVLYRNISPPGFAQTQRLTETLESSTRRVSHVRALNITFAPHSWPTVHPGSWYIADEAVQSINTLLTIVVHLQTLAFHSIYRVRWPDKPPPSNPTRRGLNSVYSVELDRLLRGCTFRLRAFSSSLVPEANDFVKFITEQPEIEELSLFSDIVLNGSRARFLIPDDLLPNLRMLHCSSTILDRLQGPHSITHLTLEYAEESKVDLALQLLGHQLVSLNLRNMKPSYGKNGGHHNALPFAQPRAIELPCLTRIVSITRTKLSGHVMSRGPPINLYEFHPPLGPIKTWVWCIEELDTTKKAASRTIESSGLTVNEFADALVAGPVPRLWPSLECFEIIRLGDYKSVSYSRDEQGQLIEREHRFASPFTWETL